MADEVPGVGINVNIRANAEDLKTKVREAGESIARLRSSLAPLNIAGLGTFRIFSSIGLSLKSLTQLAGIGLLVKQFKDVLSTGLAFNVQLEQMVLGMKAVVAANVVLTDEQGKQVEGIQKLNWAGGLIAEQIEKLKTDALVTTATLEQLVQAFQGAIPPAMGVGLQLDEIRKITVATVQAAGAIGLPMEQVAVEVREILSGTVHMRTRLAQALNIKNEDIRKWKEQGTLAKELLKRYDAFTAAGKQAGDSWQGVTSTLQDFFQQLSGAIMGPTMEAVKRGLMYIRDSLGEVRGGVFVFREEVKTAVGVVGGAVSTMVNTFMALAHSLIEIVGYLKDVDEAFGGIPKWVAGLTLLYMVINNVATSTSLLGSTLLKVYGYLRAFATTHPMIAGLMALTAAIVALHAAWRAYSPTAEDKKKQEADRGAALGKEADQIQQRISALEDLQRAVDNQAVSDAQLQVLLGQYSAEYPEFLKYLQDEKVNREALTVSIKDQEEARKKELRATRAAQRETAVNRMGINVAQRDVAAGKIKEIGEALAGGAGSEELTPEEIAALQRHAPTYAATMPLWGTAKGARAKLKKIYDDLLTKRAGLGTEAEDIKLDLEKATGLSAKAVKGPKSDDQIKKEQRAVEDIQIERKNKEELAEVDEKLANVERARRQAMLDPAITKQGEILLEQRETEIKYGLELAKIEEQIRDKQEERSKTLNRMKDDGKSNEEIAAAILKIDEQKSDLERKRDNFQAEHEIKRLEMAKKHHEQMLQWEQEQFEHRRRLGQVTEVEEVERLRRKTESVHREERWRAEEEMIQKTRSLEEMLFNYRQKIGDITLQMEIDRYRRIAADAQRSADERIKAEIQVFEMEKKLQDEREAAADKFRQRAKAQMQREGTYDEGRSYTDAEIAAAEERYRERAVQRRDELRAKGALTDAEGQELSALNKEVRSFAEEGQKFGTDRVAVIEGARGGPGWKERLVKEQRLRELHSKERDKEEQEDYLRLGSELYGGRELTPTQAEAAAGTGPAAAAARDIATAMGLAELPVKAADAFDGVKTGYTDMLKYMEEQSAASGTKIFNNLFKGFVDYLSEYIYKQRQRGA